MISLPEPNTHSWRQGVIVPPRMCSRIVGQLPSIAGKFRENDLLIVASQDCDICCESFEDEPNIEVILCREASENRLNGNLAYGKNPRRLQLEVLTSRGPRLFELYINDRYSVPRQEIADTDEQPTILLSPQLRRVFRRWLARRYQRAALPTSFNERCREAQRILNEKLGKVGGVITSVYLLLDPREEELDESQEYQLLVYLTVERETADSLSKMEEALKAKTVFDKAFASCDGIRYLGCEVVSEAEFTLEDIGRCDRWDYADHSSLKATPAKPLAPEA